MKEKFKKINIIYLVLVIVALAGVSFGVYTNVNKSPKTITVTGTAEKKYSNQISSYYLTIEIKNVDKVKAVDELSKQTAEAVNKVKEFGIDQNDIKTQSLNVYQEENAILRSGEYVNEPGDWRASYSIEIVLRDLSKSVELTALLTGIENSSLWGPNLIVDDSKNDYDELLVTAMGDAREKAEKMAKSMGGKVGKVLQVDEGNTSGEYGVMKMDMAVASGGGGFPIEPGNTSVSRTVTVTFELK